MRVRVLRCGALALELCYLFGRGLPALDLLEEPDEVFGLLRFRAAHEKVLQAMGFGSGSHANTVVDAASLRKWCALDTTGPDCSLFLACIPEGIPS